MDAFVGKPVSPERLAEALAQVVLRRRRGVVAPVEHAPDDGRHAVLNRSVLDDDYMILGPEKTGRMVDAFFGGAARKVEQLAHAVEGEDWSTVAYIAHNLKGSAASLGLSALENRAQRLEVCARKEAGSGIARDFDAFRRAVRELDGGVARLLGKARRSAADSASGDLRGEHVAFTVHGDDELRRFRVAFELAAQPSNQHVHRASPGSQDRWVMHPSNRSRVRTVPGCAISAFRSSNSARVSATLSPAGDTSRRERTSNRHPENVMVPDADGVRVPVRRSSVLTRARSSLGLNGLVT